MSKPAFKDWEIETIRLVLLDYSAKQIAANLHISCRTVEKRILQMIEQHNVTGRVGLVLKAIQEGAVAVPFIRPNKSYCTIFSMKTITPQGGANLLANARRVTL